jgi:hypothetical protein
MKLDADELLNAIGDDTLRNIVTKAFDQAGIQPNEQCVTAAIQAIKQGVQQACDDWNNAQQVQAVQAMIQREVRKFFRQIGGRYPNGHQIL